MVSIEGGNSLVLKGFSERSFEKVLTVLQSANLRGRAAANVKRGEWNRNSISRPSLIPVRCARISPPWNHHTITLIRLSFIFRSPFLFLLILRLPRKRAAPTTPQPSPSVVSCYYGSSNFEVRTVFDVATNCSFAMQSSESRIKIKRQIIQVIEHRKVSNACSSTHLLFLSN